MKVVDAMADYLAYIKHERGLSKMTVRHYQSNLRALMRWMDENGYPDPLIDILTMPLMRRYLYAMSARGLRARSIHTAFHGIRGLCEFLKDNGAVEVNPVDQLTMPKKGAATRKTVSEDEVRALFRSAELQPTLRQVVLYRAVLSILVYGGLRRQETCDLHVDDVNLKEKSILVRAGKGNKSRKIYVCSDCVDALREWLAVREATCYGDWLFMHDRSRRIHHQGIATILKELKATADLRDRNNIVPHALRHFCASNLLRNGADMKSIQVFLGHTMLQTTAVYLHASEEQLRDISELGSLRERQSEPEPPKRNDPKERLRRFRRELR